MRRVERGGSFALDAWGVYLDDLDETGQTGRVSFVKGKAPQNLEAALEAVEAEVRRQEESIEARREKALEILGRH